MTVCKLCLSSFQLRYRVHYDNRIVQWNVVSANICEEASQTWTFGRNWKLV